MFSREFGSAHYNKAIFTCIILCSGGKNVTLDFNFLQRVLAAPPRPSDFCL